MTCLPIKLNADQEAALSAIKSAYAHGCHYLLTGYAGSGKTTLMQQFARDMRKRRLDIVLTAPTHKAVAVLSRKIAEAGLADVPCRTIHSLLSLKPKPYGDRMVFVRDKRADPVTADIVVVDECSMVGEDLLKHIKRHLPMAFVLFVGDPAQLPPVGEVASQTFATKKHSHLDTIVRQSAGNPVLDAAHAIRASQGGEADWSWCKSQNAPPVGLFRPGPAADEWMRKAFTSAEFERDSDSFRYLAWTNRRVAEVNAKVRYWRYGENIPTPFMPGERAMFRAPLFVDKKIAFNTNEEATVRGIEEGSFSFKFPACDAAPAWTAELATWVVALVSDEGRSLAVHMPRDDHEFEAVVSRVKDEAIEDKYRWKDLHEFQSSLARLQSIYAMTTHCSQGSTFTNVFLDVPDIRQRERSNLLECQQMFYVAATRPTHALMLVE